MLSNPQEIAEAFAFYQKAKVQFYNPENDMTSADIVDNVSLPLLAVLNKHNISLNQLLPTITPSPSPQVNENEVLAALRSFRGNSSPGPSGQGKSFYAFLFKFNKVYFTNAINQLLQTKNFESSHFAWIKQRNIIFIKKNPTKKPLSALSIDLFIT